MILILSNRFLASLMVAVPVIIIVLDSFMFVCNLYVEAVVHAQRRGCRYNFQAGSHLMSLVRIYE